MITRRHLMLTAATIALALPATAQEATRTHLVIADQFVPEILDGQQSTGGYALSHELISQPLMRYDATAGVFVPDLLESFALSADGKTLTMVLPAGYVYSNGNPLDAAALKATVERFVAISPYASDYAGITEVTVVDPLTVRIVNDLGFNVMLPDMVTSFGAAWDVVAATEAGDAAFAANPVGSGPFRIDVPWVPGMDLELVRNDSYRTAMPFVQNSGPAHLERVTTRFISDAQTRANELEAGTVDIAFGLPASALEYMTDDPAYQIFKVALPGITGLTFNTMRAPFDDPALRRALAMAVNRGELAQIMAGAAEPESAFVTPSMIGYRPEAREYSASLYPEDPDGARAALAALGWSDTDGDGILDKDGQPLAADLLIDSGSAIDTGAAPVLQAQMKAVGMDLNITQLDLRALYDTANAGNYDLALTGYIWSDPDILTYRFTEGATQSQYAPPELGAALSAARSIADPAARAAAYLDIQKSIMDDAPVVPLLTETLIIGARSWVQGITILPPDRLILNDVMIVE
jgi:peptide/nickel transport system substrate-binding protein